jgi:hypothetical protein
MNRLILLILIAANFAQAQPAEPGGPPDEWPAEGEDRYANFRGPLRRAPFVVLPDGAVEPTGWLKAQLAAYPAPTKKAPGTARDRLLDYFEKHNRAEDDRWIDKIRAEIEPAAREWRLGVPAKLSGPEASAEFATPAILHQLTGRRRDRDASFRAYDMLSDHGGQFPGGVFQLVRDGDPDDPARPIPPRAALHQFHSHLILSRLTADTAWMDRAEDLAFNTLPTLTGPTAAQLVECTTDSDLKNDLAHAWAQLARHATMATSDAGLAVLFPLPMSVTAKAGNGAVKLEIGGDYPFGDTVELRVTCSEANNFPLYLRCPGWCDQSVLSRRGKDRKIEPGQYAKLTNWPKGTSVVRFQFPCQPRVMEWEEHRQCASVHLGPLAFSAKIAVKKGKDNNIISDSPWNYGLIYADADPGDSFSVRRRELPKDSSPFLSRESPLELSGLARRIPGWKRAGPLQPSPARTSELVETMTLIPMGSATLRITLFPRASDAEDANEWK